jgi:cytochrome P450
VAENDSKRTDLLTRLIEAKDPVTGETLDIAEIRQEAFGMIVAGSHTTATTMTFLFYHLLHSPQAMEKLERELIESNPGTRLSAVDRLADSKYLQACIKENFRYTPTFVMPLPRHVPEGGREIAGEFIPGGVCSYSHKVNVDHRVDCESCASSKQAHIRRGCR